MYSFAWPNMFTTTSSNLIEDKAAIRSNLYLLFNSRRLSLFGDPYYGTDLTQMFFEQNTALIADLIIDEIFTTIQNFIPQIFVDRKDIKITSDKTDLFANIRCTYKLDNTSDMYVINLTNTGIEEG